MYQSIINRFTTKLAIVATALSLTGCSMMHEGEDIEGCPTGNFVVQFVYDYNIQRADMFRDHVGEVALYVYDEDGRFVTSRTVSDKQRISDRNNRFNITLRAGNANTAGADLIAGKKYRFVAVAGQKGGAILPTSEALPYASAASERARYRYAEPKAGSHFTDLHLALDRFEAPDANGNHLVSNAASLDTLWHTLGTLPTGEQSTNTKAGWNAGADALVEVRPDIVDSLNVKPAQPEDTLTLSLIRDTKHLHVSLHELGEGGAGIGTPGNVSADDYEVFITDVNGQLDYQNDLLGQEPLIYRPYAERTQDETDAGVAGTTAHWDMMFNRLLIHDKPQDDARLQIVRKNDGEVVASLSLPRILSYGRNALDYSRYTEQGYLDREYNYNLAFYLKNGKWESTEIWIGLDVNILAWAIRTQDVKF